MPGFKVQSTHPFVNPQPEQGEPTPDPYYGHGYTLAPPQAGQQPRSRTNAVTSVRTGSAKGMAMRTSMSAIADFY